MTLDLALSYLDDARAALTTAGVDRDAILQARRSIRIADMALADLMKQQQ
jgi:hypothetical protein